MQFTWNIPFPYQSLLHFYSLFLNCNFTVTARQVRSVSWFHFILCSCCNFPLTGYCQAQSPDRGPVALARLNKAHQKGFAYQHLFVSYLCKDFLLLITTLKQTCRSEITSAYKLMIALTVSLQQNSPGPSYLQMQLPQNFSSLWLLLLFIITITVQNWS